MNQNIVLGTPNDVLTRAFEAPQLQLSSRDRSIYEEIMISIWRHYKLGRSNELYPGLADKFGTGQVEWAWFASCDRILFANNLQPISWVKQSLQSGGPFKPEQVARVFGQTLQSVVRQILVFDAADADGGLNAQAGVKLVLSDEGCKAQDYFAAAYRFQIEAGSRHNLPPFFPLDDSLVLPDRSEFVEGAFGSSFEPID